MDVLLAQAVFIAILNVTLAGINHEDALAGGGIFLVEYQDAGGDAGAVKEVGGQTDDSFEVAGTNELGADDRLGIAAEQHAVRQDAGALAPALQGPNNVQQIGIVALLGGVSPMLQVLSENGGLATT